MEEDYICTHHLDKLAQRIALHLPQGFVVTKIVHQLLLSSPPHQVELHKSADHHRLIHSKGRHEELGGLGQEDHQGYHKRGDGEERCYPTCLRNLKIEY